MRPGELRDPPGQYQGLVEANHALAKAKRVHVPNREGMFVEHAAALAFQEAATDTIRTLIAENAALREERDALLQKPIDLAKMDSIDDDNGTPEKMVAYYWHQQAEEARAECRTLIAREERLRADIEAKREDLRVTMLEQPTTGERRTYSDGFAMGIGHAIWQIDAALNPKESDNAE
jgi:outer membrane murein-binding lipoprotein Lpp